MHIHINTKILNFFTQKPAEIQYPEFPFSTSPFSSTPNPSNFPHVFPRTKQEQPIKRINSLHVIFFFLPGASSSSPWSCSPTRRQRQGRRR